MKKLWLRWIALAVFVVVIGCLFVRLGEWQLHRLHARRATNAQVVAFQKAPVKPYEQVMRPGVTIQDNQQWQRVTLTGTYDAKHQLQAMLRNTNDATNQPGSEVLTPMHTTQGDWVLVDRGFLVRAQGASELAVLPAPPSGTVTVTGYLRRNERGDADAITPASSAVRLVNSPAISATLPYRLLDGYVGVVSSTPAQSGGMLPMSTPELTEGPHLSYAIQWFCFTAIAVGGAVVLIRADLADRRKLAAKREKAAQRRAARAAQQPAEEPRQALQQESPQQESPQQDRTHDTGASVAGTTPAHREAGLSEEAHDGSRA